MQVFDLNLTRPWMNAAGSLGFAPDPHGPLSLSGLGAFITNPVSLKPRTPARERGFIPYPGGFLIHTGYPNPGLRAAIQRYATRWRRSLLPVWVHLLAQDPEEAGAMVRRLENLEGVSGVELGLPPEVEAETAVRMALAAAGELPVILRLPLDRAADLGQAVAAGLKRYSGIGPATGDASVYSAGPAEVITAFSLGPPRGALTSASGDRTTGRLYGPAIFPLALAAVQALQKTGLPVIGAGGIYHTWQAEAMLASGAAAVQVDAVLWRGGFNVPAGS